jgi:subtilisin family serine protease
VTRARRAALAAALLGAVLPRAAGAQRPAVSPPLAAAWGRDTTFTVWLFVRDRVPLDTAVAHVAAAGARLRERSRWLHAVSVAAPAAALRVLARDPALRRIQPLGRWLRSAPSRDTLPAWLTPAAVDTCAAGGDPVAGPSDMPYRQLNLRGLTDRGVTGAGVRIALLDTGFDTANPAFAGVAVAAQRDFVFGDGVVRDEAGDAAGAHFHGTAVWSLLAAAVPGRLRGVASGATYLLAKTEDVRSETRVEEDHFVAALEWADSIGTDLASASLGYLRFDNGFGYTPSQLNGDIAVTTVAVDHAAARGILVLSAAGNAGPGFRTLVTPADADSGLAVGAEDSLGAIAPFSSRGPTSDGRIKPDLTAPGASVCALVGVDAVRRVDGTSFATPLVAGAAALVREVQPALGPVALADALRAHASHRAAPDSIRGAGRPDVTASAVFPLGVAPAAPLAGPVASVTPGFSWTVGATPTFATPVEFRLRIATDSQLTAPLVDTTLDAATFAPMRALPPGPLWWRVDARAASGETASTGIVGSVAIPPWATLLTLNDAAGVTTADSQPLLRWTAPAIAVPPGPFRFDVQVRPVAPAGPALVFPGLTDTALVVPQPLERGASYRWAVVSRAGGDSSVTESAGTFLVLDSQVPLATLLHQNFPNPFGATATCVWFDLSSPAAVELQVLDLRGRLVRTLVPGPGVSGFLPAGRYGRGPAGSGTCDPAFTWDGTAADGEAVPAGVYVVRLKAGGRVQFKRAVYSGRGG